MRILNAIRSVSRAEGGPVEAVFQTSLALEKFGHESEVVSVDGARDTCVRNCPVRVSAVGPGRGKYGYAPALVPWLKKHACEYDVTLVHGVWDYSGLGVWRALRKLETPYFVYTHGMLDPWFKRTYPLKHLKKWLYWPWAAYRMLRDARGVLFTAEEEKCLARESFWLYRCRELVVNYGTTATVGDKIAQRDVFFKAYPHLRDKRIVLFLSRIHAKKGCDLLLKAFAELAGRDESLHLVMAGPDRTKERPKLQTLADNLGITRRVTWTGMLSGGAKWGALHSAEVFILPSHQENFGVAVAEALAAGLPVLITNKVNIWREIEGDGAGFVGNDDARGVTEMLQRWLALSGREKEWMGQRARACFVNRFDIQQAAQQLVLLLRQNGVRG